jgi:hypothetical protein
MLLLSFFRSLNEDMNEGIASLKCITFKNNKSFSKQNLSKCFAIAKACILISKIGKARTIFTRFFIKKQEKFILNQFTFPNLLKIIC